MTVYVDTMEAKVGRMIFCHMWADTLDELLAMVDKIGVQRKWIQGHPTLSLPRYRKASWCHFDITKAKKAAAIKAGAVLTDLYGPVEFTTKLRMQGINQWTLLKDFEPSAEQMARWQNKLDDIARVRATTEPA